jgi:hypothetical protein
MSVVRDDKRGPQRHISHPNSPAGLSPRPGHEQFLVDPNYLPTASGQEVLARLFDRVEPGTRAAVPPTAWNTARTRYPGFWEGLRDRRVHVVFLKRRNMLRWYLSYCVARATGIWSTDRQAAAPHPKTRICPADCVNTILLDRQYEEAAMAYFVDHPQMEIVYEDLVRNCDEEIVRLQRFLHLEPRTLRPLSVKQERRPLAAAIENFTELRAEWKGTQWERFLDPDTEACVEADAARNANTESEHA